MSGKKRMAGWNKCYIKEIKLMRAKLAWGRKTAGNYFSWSSLAHRGTPYLPLVELMSAWC